MWNIKARNSARQKISTSRLNALGFLAPKVNCFVLFKKTSLFFFFLIIQWWLGKKSWSTVGEELCLRKTQTFLKPLRMFCLYLLFSNTCVCSPVCEPKPQIHFPVMCLSGLRSWGACMCFTVWTVIGRDALKLKLIKGFGIYLNQCVLSLTVQTLAETDIYCINYEKVKIANAKTTSKSKYLEYGQVCLLFLFRIRFNNIKANLS